MQTKEETRTNILEAIRHIDYNPSIARDILFKLFHTQEEAVDYQTIINDFKSPHYQSMIAHLIGRAYHKASDSDSLIESVINEVDNDVLFSTPTSKAIAFALCLTMIGDRNNKKEFFEFIANN